MMMMPSLMTYMYRQSNVAKAGPGWGQEGAPDYRAARRAAAFDEIQIEGWVRGWHKSVSVRIVGGEVGKSVDFKGTSDVKTLLRVDPP